MPSIIDPRECRGGCWAATRGLLQTLEIAFPDVVIDCVSLESRSRARHRLRQITSITSAMLDGSTPAKIRFATSPTMRGRVKHSIAAKEPDLILINGTDLLWLLPHLPRRIPTIVIVHNIEHELYASQIDSIDAPFRYVKTLLHRDLEKLERFEWDGLRRIDGAIFLSAADQETALKTCPGIRSIALPPAFGYDPLPRHRPDSDKLRLGMFANFTWWPNVDALRWFMSDVWPHVPQTVELRLFGYGSERVAQRTDRVTHRGFVEDPAAAFAECDMMIAPALTGAGVKVKVAESLHNKVPVVASPLSLRGLGAEAHRAVRSCVTSTDWVTFLATPSAREFAAANVSDEIADAFSPASAAAVAGPFIQQYAGRHPRLLYRPVR